MADAEVATPADEGVTVDSVDTPMPPPPPSQPAATADPTPPTVNGIPEPVVVAVAAVPKVDMVEEAPSKSAGTYPSIGPPRIDVSDDSQTTTISKYELHDKDTESADRVAAALKSARLQVHYAVLLVLVLKDSLRTNL